MDSRRSGPRTPAFKRAVVGHFWAHRGGFDTDAAAIRDTARAFSVAEQSVLRWLWYDARGRRWIASEP